MRLRELWDRGEPTLGGWCGIPSGVSAELLGHCGFDWICIDTQHGLIGYDQLIPMLQGLSITGTPAFVRPSWNAPGEIMKALDAGAQGVIVPMVNSPQEARQAAGACRYAPDGYRSWGPVRASLGVPDFNPRGANRDVVCAVMVETAEGLANIHQIATTPGVDAIFVGPNDLAVSSGLEPSFMAEHPEHRSQIERILEACLEHDVTAGIFCGSAEMALRWREQGFRMLALESDARLLRKAAQDLLAAVRGEVAQPVASKAAYA
jgi:4-hydroxy-2-oxoheptanedioate aldolase